MRSLRMPGVRETTRACQISPENRRQAKSSQARKRIATRQTSCRQHRGVSSWQTNKTVRSSQFGNNCDARYGQGSLPVWSHRIYRGPRLVDSSCLPPLCSSNVGAESARDGRVAGKPTVRTRYRFRGRCAPSACRFCPSRNSPTAFTFCLQREQDERGRGNRINREHPHHRCLWRLRSLLISLGRRCCSGPTPTVVIGKYRKSSCSIDGLIGS
jgi:hypothetical protein